MSTKRFCFVLIVLRRNEKREVLCKRVKSRVKCSLWTRSPPPPPFLLLFKNLGCIPKGSRDWFSRLVRDSCRKKKKGKPCTMRSIDPAYQNSIGKMRHCLTPPPASTHINKICR